MTPSFSYALYGERTLGRFGLTLYRIELFRNDRSAGRAWIRFSFQSAFRKGEREVAKAKGRWAQ